MTGDTQRHLEETFEDVLACSVAIDGSADVTDIDHLALCIQVFNEKFPYKNLSVTKGKTCGGEILLSWRIFYANMA